MKFPDVEQHVKFWVVSMRDLSLCITCPMIVCEVLNTFPDIFTSFKQCGKWVYNVLDRLELSVRAKTHGQGQLEEKEMGEIPIYFLEHFERLPRLIVNMDETGCHFNMASNKTITQKGSTHVNIKASKASNHCTVFLAVALDGSKLKPLVVFKGKPGARITRSLSICDQRNSYICQENGFCDQTVMAYRIEQSLIPFNPEKKVSMIMMDNFAAHNVATIREKITDAGWVHLCLPPNMTSRVQLLDVAINKPFKDRMKRYYNQYMVDNIRMNPKVTRELMGTWIADSWADISPRFIENGCRSIGLRVDQMV